MTADADITVKLYLEGAGGGTSKRRSVQGGAGGKAEGIFTFLKDQNYMLRIGGNGAGMSHRHRTGGGNGSGNGSHGGGGGYTGLFIGSSTPDYTQDNVIIMAGGGGGGSNDPATGGVGGGDRGAGGSNAPGRGGRRVEHNLKVEQVVEMEEMDQHFKVDMVVEQIQHLVVDPVLQLIVNLVVLVVEEDILVVEVVKLITDAVLMVQVVVDQDFCIQH